MSKAQGLAFHPDANVQVFRWDLTDHDPMGERVHCHSGSIKTVQVLGNFIGKVGILGSCIPEPADDSAYQVIDVVSTPDLRTLPKSALWLKPVLQVDGEGTGAVTVILIAERP